MSNDLQILDARGRPMEKAGIYEGQVGSSEGCWRGPILGYGELGGLYQIGPFDMGFQRNLEPFSTAASCAALFAAINVNAQSVATIPMHHHRLLDNGGRERITTSALSRVLRTPNTYQTYSDFMLNAVFSLLAYGNAYALAVRNDRNEVDALHLMPSRSVVPYIDTETKAIYYGLGDNPLVDPLEVMIPQRDVLHIKLHTPFHPLVGVSPIRHAATAIGINTAVGHNQQAFFSNMSRPSGVLTTDEKLTKEQMNALRDAWNERSRGLAAGEVPILTWGLKWQPMTITSEDAQLIDAYRMSIEDIARVFRVPPILIGDLTKATYANAENMINSWLATGLGFLLEHLEKALTKFFRLPQNEIVDFDVTTLLRTDFETRIKGYSTAAMSGIMSPNEIRAKEGLPAVAFGDEPRVQAQNLPLSAVGNMPATPETPDTPPAPISEPEPTEEEQLAAVFVARKMIEKAMFS